MMLVEGSLKTLVVIVATLLTVFLLGFFASGEGSQVRVALGLIAITLTLVIALVAGSQQRDVGLGVIAGGTLSLAALLTFSSGVYMAYLVGWHGLKLEDFGHEGGGNYITVLFTVLYLAGPAIVLGAIAALLGRVAFRQRGFPSI